MMRQQENAIHYTLGTQSKLKLSPTSLHLPETGQSGDGTLGQTLLFL